MPDFLEALRLKNLFGGPMLGNDLPQQGGITDNMPPPNFPTTMGPVRLGGRAPIAQNPFGGGNALGGGMDAPPDEYNVGNRIKEIYSPETEATDRLNNLLAQYPERNKPGFLRTIAAGLVKGANPRSNVEEMLYGGHNQAVEDWKNQVGPAGTAANVEKGNNANERSLAYQTVAQELRQQAIDNKDKTDQRRLDISEHRAQTYDFKARNPNLKLVFPKGGNVQAVDPITGEAKDTGIPTGSMTEMDKINLGHENRTAEIEQKGDITSRQIGERGAESRETAITRGVQARETKGTPAAGVGNKAELPTQTRIRQFNAARELANTRPELKQFIKVGNPGSNDFVITPPGKNFFNKATGPTPEQYKEIQDKIYGKEALPIAQPKRTGAPVTTGVKPATDDRITVSKGGKKFSVPRTQMEQAKAQGYKVE